MHEEINRLPEKYRVLIVLCYLEGRTTEEASRHLGCPRGTVCSRLATARERLRSRLVRRGVTLGGVAVATTLGAGTAPAMVPPALAQAAVCGAVCFPGDEVATGLVSVQVMSLANGVIRTMFLNKLKVVAGLFLLLGAFGAGAGLLAQPGADQIAIPDNPQLVTGHENALRLPPDMLARVGIQAAVVRQREVPPRLLKLAGSLAIDPTRLARIRSRVGGQVVEIGKWDGPGEERDLRVGDRVKKGQLLTVLRSKDLGEKKSALVDALVQLALDQKILEEAQKNREAVPKVFILTQTRAVQGDRNAINRALNTLKVWDIPQDEIDALHEEARKISADKKVWFKTPEGRWVRGKKQGKTDSDKGNENPWGRVTLRAPFDGTLVEKNIHVSEVIDPGPGINLFQIADLSQLKVLATVDEPSLHALQALETKELHGTIHVAGDPNAKPLVECQLMTLEWLRDPNTVTALLSGTVANREGRLRPGQFVRLTIPLPPASRELVVPASALVEQAGQTFVFVQPDPAQPVYEARRVAVVRRGRDMVHVRSSLLAEERSQGLQVLRPGDRVITGGAIELKALLDDLKGREKP